MLVVHLHELHAGRRRRVGRVGGAPQLEAVDDVAAQLVAEVGDGAAQVGDAQARPPGEVLQRRRAVAAQEAPDQLGHRVVGPRRRWHALVEPGVGVRGAVAHAADDDRVELEQHEQVPEAAGVEVEAGAGDHLRDLRAGERATGHRRLDRPAGRRHDLVVEPELAAGAGHLLPHPRRP